MLNAATDPALLQLCASIFDRLQDAIVQAPPFLSAMQVFAVQDTLFANFDRESYLTTSLMLLPR